MLAVRSKADYQVLEQSWLYVYKELASTEDEEKWIPASDFPLM